MITQLKDKCPICHKVAHEKSRKEYGAHTIIFLECNHILMHSKESTSNFASIVFDGDDSCKHEWDKTICQKCNAKKLYPYQIKGAQFLEKNNGRAAIFDEMGLGKTIQALAYLKFHPEAYPFLWVTKSGIKYQHAKEITRVLGDDNFPVILRGSKDHFIKGVAGYVMSYDLFRNMDLEKIQKANIKCIVLDECQAIKNPDSSRTKSLRRVISGDNNGEFSIPKVIPLSGTPWKNRGTEFFTILNMLDATRFGNYERFKHQWIDEYWDGNRLKIGGIRNPEKFREYIKDIAIRRERSEVMPELPSISRLKLTVELQDYARKEYDKLRDKIIDDYNNAVIGGEEDSLQTQQKIMKSLIIMRQIIGIAKIPHTIEWLQEFLEETDRKVVCFVHHIECGDRIYEEMKKYCLENRINIPLRITSGMDPEKRFETQEKFNGNGYRILIGSTLASGEGLNLQTCSDCIMHERQWNPANEEQAEGRFIRIGQTANAVNATYVHADNTCDTELDGIVERKRRWFHNAMNKGTLPTWNEGSIIQELIKGMVKR